MQYAHSLQHSSDAAISFHFIAGLTTLEAVLLAPWPSLFKLTLKIKYLSVLFGYLYTGHEYIDFSDDLSSYLALAPIPGPA